MKKPVYIASDNIVSPLGNTTAVNYNSVKLGHSGIHTMNNTVFSDIPLCASVFDDSFSGNVSSSFTRFEEVCITSIQQALTATSISLDSPDTIFILSSTKGNIALIENHEVSEEIRKRVSLHQTAKFIAAHFKSPNVPVVVSNACISGVLSILVARRLLQSGKYTHAVITGADVLSKFIVSGFQALHASSDTPCRPFDKNRNGINLGECASTLVLTTDKARSKHVVVNAGAGTNDANHISGPSRTGEELAYAITSAITESNIAPADLAFISAHGTATIYNDEMESKAFALASLSSIPLHSLKGNYGHTLGAAGVLESVLTIHSLLEGVVLPSKNFEEAGVSAPVVVNRSLMKTDKAHALKTASGFGGCNAAIVYSLQ